MECPKCFGDMKMVCIAEGEGVNATEVQRCDACGGIYVESLTKRHVDSLAAQVAVDSGDPHVGEGYDMMVYVDCPRCGDIMDQRKGEFAEIRFELCPTCYGTLLDAGELSKYLSTDLKDQFCALLPE